MRSINMGLTNRPKVRPARAGVLGVWIYLAGLAFPSVWAGDLRVGRAEVDLTPPVGMPIGGQFYYLLSTGRHDDLHAKALVMEKDGVRVAVVACDLVGIPARIAKFARQSIEKTSGLPADRVMISATLTHNGPQMYPIIPSTVQPQTAKIIEEYFASLTLSAILPGRMAKYSSIILAVSGCTVAGIIGYIWGPL